MIEDASTISSPYAVRADLPEGGDLPRRIGRYVPVRRLGRGGMGDVYEAFDPALGRKVAVKVLHRHRQADTDESRARRRRLLREAQAMARLSHPNVLPVFDVGEAGTDVFLAMELVAGCSLADWLTEEDRPWREIVHVFLAAGRGLAAAHTAGVVHRDFKPANVLVGDDGCVRVVDFGLARSADSDEREVGAIGTLDPESRNSPWHPLTGVGAVLGTPAYMAPEQRRGGKADARSDQYSFCISLWQALGGHLLGLLPEPPSVTDGTGAPHAPRGLRRALLRGLRLDPAARHPSMDALLAELDRLLRRRRRWLLAAGAVAATVGVAGAALGARTDSDPPVCRAAGRHLDGVWDDAARKSLRSQFARSGSPGAAASAARVVERLDDYTRSWVTMRTEACEATHVHGEQSAALLDLRMRCLDRRLDQAGAVVTVLGDNPGPGAIAGAVDAVWRLEPLDACADPAGLAEIQAFPLPVEPGRRARIQELRGQLDRAAALYKAGRYAAGRDVAAQVAAAAAQLAYPPLHAEALLLHGELLDFTGSSEDAERTLRAAASVAAEAEDDELLASAWVSLVFTVGVQLARHEEALQLAGLAATAATRAKSPRVRGMLENHTGAVLKLIGRYPEAERSFARAVELRTAALGPSHPDTASSLANLGTVLFAQGKVEEAERMQQRALTIRRAAFGDDHPVIAGSWTALARLAKDNIEATEREKRALAIRERTLGPEHADVGISHANLGGYAEAQGHHAEAAVHYERALAIFTAALPPDHPHTARVLRGLGESYVHLGRAVDAVAPLERALAIHEKLEEPVVLADAEYALATAVDAAFGQRRRARELMMRARDHYARGSDPEAAKWKRVAEEWLARHPAASGAGRADSVGAARSPGRPSP